MNENAILERFQLVVDAVSPIHVGSGDPPLLPEFDYLATEDQIVVVDPDRAAAQVADPETFEDGRLAAVAADQAARYRLPFAGGSPPRQIIPALRDAWSRPYLPGSALKGALRTLLAGVLIERDRAGGKPLRAAELAPTNRFAGQPVERRLFGDQPGSSALRAVQVSDLQPTSEAAAVALTGVYTIDEKKLSLTGDRIAAEILPPGSRLVGDLRFDRAFQSTTDPRIEPTPGRAIVDDLVTLGQDAARRRIDAERDFYRAHGAARLVSYYEALGREAASPAEGSFLIQIGWGAGWESKSFGPALKNSPDWRDIRERYLTDPSRRPRRPGNRPDGRGDTRGDNRPRAKSDAPFPVSRRLVEQGGSPELPLGWVRVWLVPVGQPLPEAPEPIAVWQDQPFPAESAAAAPAAAEPEPATPWSVLRALLGDQPAETTRVEEAPLPPIAPVSDRNLKPGTILDAEIVEIEEKRLLVNLGRSTPAAMDSGVLGGGDLRTRFQVGQRIRVRVLTPPPFFRIRLA